MAMAVDYQVQELPPMYLANVAWALATVARPLDAALLTKLAIAAGLQLVDFKPQEMGNTTWAFAVMTSADAWLFSLIARKVPECAIKCKSQEIANTAWALATASLWDVPLMKAFAV
eukprot:gnl/MRDRNA2_/MRDRNA2_431324_c0_seq1.p1 gnl/MRDRNA2_/MRDRNA2_431324_c0~~gnl/MRDRNA2_/MRDRNA2_431324_c0_seq1.p1  ORF type:complete len:116 (+),score=20.56 gnl/MRDRNA2_/MRDRNA2_431324_c0_seq1:156-503(+)